MTKRYKVETFVLDGVPAHPSHAIGPDGMERDGVRFTAWRAYSDDGPAIRMARRLADRGLSVAVVDTRHARVGGRTTGVIIYEANC